MTLSIQPSNARPKNISAHYDRNRNFFFNFRPDICSLYDGSIITPLVPISSHSLTRSHSNHSVSLSRRELFIMRTLSPDGGETSYSSPKTVVTQCQELKKLLTPHGYRPICFSFAALIRSSVSFHHLITLCTLPFFKVTSNH